MGVRLHEVLLKHTKRAVGNHLNTFAGYGRAFSTLATSPLTAPAYGNAAHARARQPDRLNTDSFEHTKVANRYGATASITATGSVSDATAIPVYACEKSAVRSVYAAETAANSERAFYVNDLGVVDRQVNRWRTELPNVRPFYAVKCNPDSVLLNHLASHSLGFDCASGAEITAALNTGVKPHDIIFANPIKNRADLQLAAKLGVHKMTFDNVHELKSIAEHCPQAELVLRLLPDDSGSVMRFGSKFGCPAAQVDSLLLKAQELKLNIIGVSFHIGSGCFNPAKYTGAIQLSRSVFDRAVELGLPALKLLDLGGGFPGSPIGTPNPDNSPPFEAFSAVIRDALALHFPEHCGVEIIAEPGRYMATAWSTLFTLVQGKRSVPLDNSEAVKKFLYYVNDGVYGSFNCLMFDHAKAFPIPAYRLHEDKVNLAEVYSAYYSRKAQASSIYPSRSALTSQHMQYMLQSAMSDSKMAQKYSQARAYYSKPSRRDMSLSKATIFGPTCDSIDKLVEDYDMEELDVGEWLAFQHYGAYTVAAASTFNGMQLPNKHYVRSVAANPVRGH